ncbi:YHS domain-containing protein [uncultured Desulfosarcina sp.]|uniref:YHS domain-containing protein n=1 Tax=uncultured Desulfosarcina sp. TaxID=218289 RepID=UPI0029C7A652|nr:YHS domain-containing protein [uncultured Desulfosarcina sp.]
MRVLLLIVIVYLTYRAVKSWVLRNLQVPGQNAPHNPKIDDVMVKDPVCGVYFPRGEGVALRHKGQEYIFCSEACRDRFLEENGGQ